MIFLVVDEHDHSNIPVITDSHDHASQEQDRLEGASSSESFIVVTLTNETLSRMGKVLAGQWK